LPELWKKIRAGVIKVWTKWLTIFVLCRSGRSSQIVAINVPFVKRHSQKTRSPLITLSAMHPTVLFLGTSWFLFTDDGVCLQQRMSLSSKPSQKKICTGCKYMDGMETKGTTQPPKGIRQGLRQNLQSGTGNFTVIKQNWLWEKNA